jgi:hypothetical protein
MEFTTKKQYKPCVCLGLKCWTGKASFALESVATVAVSIGVPQPCSIICEACCGKTTWRAAWSPMSLIRYIYNFMAIRYSDARQGKMLTFFWGFVWIWMGSLSFWPRRGQMFTCSILLNLQKVLLCMTPDLLKKLLFRSCTVRQAA